MPNSQYTSETDEGLNYVLGLTYFGRLRMAANLLPLLQNANGLRRVVSSFTGAHEGKVYENDWPGAKVPFRALRGHAATMMTLGMEALAKKAPDVSFIHNFPGSLDTNLIRGDEGWIFWILKYVFKVVSKLNLMNFLPALEVGERHLFYCTSAKYPPRQAEEGTGTSGISLQDGLRTSRGVDGKLGSGMYSLDDQGENIGAKTEELLAEYREQGVEDRLWAYTESEFKRVTGTIAV